MSEISYEEAQFFEGVLEKKGHGLVAVFQKRYFRLLEGRIMIYTEKKDDIEIKGLFNLDQVSQISNLDSKCFKFSLEDRDFVFKAQNEEERNKWVSVLKLLKNKLIEINEQENQLPYFPGKFPKKKKASKHFGNYFSEIHFIRQVKINGKLERG